MTLYETATLLLLGFVLLLMWRLHAHPYMQVMSLYLALGTALLMICLQAPPVDGNWLPDMVLVLVLPALGFTVLFVRWSIDLRSGIRRPL